MTVESDMQSAIKKLERSLRTLARAVTDIGEVASNAAKGQPKTTDASKASNAAHEARGLS